MADRTNTPNKVRNDINRGPLGDNPRHHYSNKLEKYQGAHGSSYYPGKPTIVPKGEERNPVNHSHRVTRTDYCSNAGTSTAGHTYPGRRK